MLWQRGYYKQVTPTGFEAHLALALCHLQANAARVRPKTRLAAALPPVKHSWMPRCLI